VGQSPLYRLHTFANLAAQLGLGIRSVHKVANKLGIYPIAFDGSKRRYFTENSVKIVAEIFGNLLTSKQAAALAGVTTQEFAGLRRSGKIAYFVRIGGGSVVIAQAPLGAGLLA